MTILKWIVILTAIGYLGALVALFFAQRALIFPIPTRVRTSPVAAGFPIAEEHVLSTSDGERVIVWHVAARPDHRVILYFPGNGDTLAGSAGRFAEMIADGSGLIALSYRGYAGSSGAPSEAGLLADAAAAFAFTSAIYEEKRIVIWGFSLGTGPAVALAAQHDVGGLILEAPYTSIAEVAAAAYPMFPVRALVKDPFPSDQRITKVTAPLLVMHGGRDTTVPIRFGMRLFALAHEPKQFVRFDEGEHDNLDSFGALETARHFIAALKG
jgi:fermentation-respiration switch protein FrsA (DUF1100 family)